MPRPLLAALLLLLALPAAARAQDNEIPIAPPDPPPPSAAPSRPPPVRLRPVTVAFRANAPGVRVHYLPDPVLEDTPAGGVRVRRAAPPRYSLLCEAPCDVELPQSHFGLAFSRGEDGRLIRSIEPFGVDGRTGVRVRWDDRAGERLAGLLTLAIGAPLGLGAAALALGLDLGTGGDGVAGAIGGGVGTGVGAISIVTGILLLTMRDDASFSVTPLPDDGSRLYSERWE